ncbi:MAG: hypothetical protein KKD90_00685 [Candidatus Omnitrophica bacterium]|nr:hypothetical protein [Candidatus Omnitrophota bacterium]MBU4149706.1 hypothetical protein [Candidatus Omnitrophota bacterium]
MENQQDILLKEFHNLNNWLNKISMFAGQARYELETRGFDTQNIEAERKRYIDLLNDMEAHAIKAGEVARGIKKRISQV